MSRVNVLQQFGSPSEEYMDEDLKASFAVCTGEERILFLTFLLAGFHEFVTFLP